MPNYIPFHLAMVYISGVAEILGGLGLLFDSTRFFATWGLIALLFAVFPANIDMAIKAYTKYGLTFFTYLTFFRLPLQFFLIYWLYWAGIQNG